jgi:hypothetical protein
MTRAYLIVITMGSLNQRNICVQIIFIVKTCTNVSNVDLKVYSQR